MTLWAIVPIKPLQRSKSRLSSVLSGEDRAKLSESMLVHTLDVLVEVPEVERILVVGRDLAALALARDHSARTVTERGSPELNAALVRATLVARGYGVSSVLVLPADLPLLTVEDVRGLIALAVDPPVLVLAPDRRGVGTNAMLCAPPGAVPYGFGPDSFARHLKLAEAAGVRVEVCRRETLGLDLDLPEDLKALRAAGGRIDPLVLEGST